MLCVQHAHCQWPTLCQRFYIIMNMNMLLDTHTYKHMYVVAISCFHPKHCRWHRYARGLFVRWHACRSQLCAQIGAFAKSTKGVVSLLYNAVVPVAFLSNCSANSQHSWPLDLHDGFESAVCSPWLPQSRNVTPLWRLPVHARTRIHTKAHTKNEMGVHRVCVCLLQLYAFTHLLVQCDLAGE